MTLPVPRTPEGYHRLSPGLAPALARTLRYAPYADLLWLETSKPDLEQARKFAREVREKTGVRKWMVYNLSPSFNWLGSGFSGESLCDDGKSTIRQAGKIKIEVDLIHYRG